MKILRFVLVLAVIGYAGWLAWPFLAPFFEKIMLSAETGFPKPDKRAFAVAVNALGYAHPALVSTLEREAGSLLHVSNLYYHPASTLLAEKLVGLSGMPKVFLCNSGTEANEAAIKFTRLARPGRNRTHRRDVPAPGHQGPATTSDRRADPASQIQQLRVPRSGGAVDAYRPGGVETRRWHTAKPRPEPPRRRTVPRFTATGLPLLVCRVGLRP